MKLTNEDVVTASALPASWTAVLRGLGFDLDTVATPSGEERDWNRLLTAFERRGFLMIWAQEQADVVRFRIELALPAHAPSIALHAAMEDRLTQLGATHTEVTTQGPPRVTYTSVASNLAPDDVRAMGMMLLKLSDYVRAVEDSADAAIPFEGQPDAKEEPSDPEPSASAFEVIGEDAQGDTASASEESASAPSAFETIGGGEPEVVGGEVVHLKAFLVSAPSPDVDVHLTLDTHPDASLRRVLTRGLKQALEVRFDVQVQEEPRDDDAITFRVQSASSSYPLSARDRDDMESFFNRLVKFGALGMDLFGALNLNAQGDLSPSSRARREHDTLTSLPRLTMEDGRASQRPQHDAPEDVEDSVVLSFEEEPSAPAQDEPLEPQRYDDERLNRPDATTALVDIILRHPGFSDRRIGQVLSILLSIDTLQAKNLIVQAPCPISWGVSRERALTFKSAIEGAGAKAHWLNQAPSKPANAASVRSHEPPLPSLQRPHAPRVLSL